MPVVPDCDLAAFTGVGFCGRATVIGCMPMLMPALPPLLQPPTQLCFRLKNNVQIKNGIEMKHTVLSSKHEDENTEVTYRYY